jgi:hypothetical protein
MKASTSLLTFQRWAEKREIPFALSYDPSAPAGEKWEACWPDGCGEHEDLQGGMGSTVMEALADTKYLAQRAGDQPYRAENQ